MNKEKGIKELARDFVEKNLYKAEGFYLYGGDMSEGLAEHLLEISNADLRFTDDIERGMKFILDNALYFEDIYEELSIDGIEINPLRDMQDCISRVFIFAMRDYLLDSSLINEHEHDEGFLIELTKEVIDKMMEDMGMEAEKENDFER